MRGSERITSALSRWRFIRALTIAAAVAIPCVATTSPATALPGQQQARDAQRTALRPSSVAAERIRLAITGFEFVGSGDYELLARTLPAILGAGMIGDEQVEYVDVAHRDAGTNIDADTRLPIPGGFIDDETLESYGIDVVVAGFVWEDHQRVRLEAYVEHRTEGASREVASPFFSVEDLDVALKNFRASIRAEALSLTRGTVVSNVAVLCFVESLGSDEKTLKLVGEDLAFALSTRLEPDNHMVVPWRTTGQFCSTTAFPDEAVLEEIGADMALTGEVKAAGEQLVIEPRLMVRGLAPIQLPSLSGPTLEYFELETRLSQELTDALNTIAFQNGALNLEPLLFETDAAKEYIERGQLYADENPYIAALMWSKAIDVEPENDEAYLLLADLRAEQGREREAVALYERLLAGNPKLAEAWIRLGDLRLERDEWQQAVAAYERGLELAPEAASRLNRRIGDARLFSGDTNAAIVWYEAALAADTTDMQSFIGLARAYRSTGRSADAVALLEQALDLEPDNAIVREDLGNLFAARGGAAVRNQQYEAALTAYERSNELRPLAHTYGWITFVLNELDRGEELLAVVAEAEERGLADDAVLNNAGWALAADERYAEAVEFFRRAVEIDANDTVILRNLASSLVELDRVEEALNTLDAAASAEPDNSAVYYDMARALGQLNRWDDALAAVERAAELGYENRGILANQRAWIFSELGRFEDSIAAAEEAIVDRSYESGTPYNHKGYSLYRLGDPENGRPLIDKAMKDSPEYGGAFYNLARIALLEGDEEEAFKQLENAVGKLYRYRLRALTNPEFAALHERIRVEIPSREER